MGYTRCAKRCMAKTENVFKINLVCLIVNSHKIVYSHNLKFSQKFLQYGNIMFYKKMWSHVSWFLVIK